jgi:hypothetical protein
MAFSDDVQGILAEVEKNTGYRVQTIPDATLTMIATVKTATPAFPVHIIRYNPEKPGVDYHVAFECGFLLRLFENPPSERYQFAGTDFGRKRVQEALSTNKQIKRLGVAPSVITETANKFYDGLMLQLRSVPTGMRVDQWLWREHSALRETQTDSMLGQLRDNLQGLKPEIQKIAPREVWVANTSMNAAYAMFFDHLMGTFEQSIPYSSAGVEATAETLLRIWGETPAEPTSDCKLVDAWGDELQLKDWYQWIPFPDI